VSKKGEITMSEVTEKFKQVAEKLPETGDDCLAIINTQIDPDSTGGTLGLSYLLRKLYRRKSEIFYCGSVSHPQNRYLFNKYKLTARMKPITELTNFDRPIALVDSNSVIDDRLPSDCKLPTPTIIIDHHCESASLADRDDAFWLIDGDVGSACTLVIELFQELEFKLDDDEWGEKLATMLALGLFEDTKGLVSAGDRDCSAYNYITNFCSRAELAELRKYKRPVPYFTHMSKALDRMDKRGARLVTGIGGSTEHSDDVAAIADELLRMEGVTLVAVWVWIAVNDELRLSVRSDNPTFSLDEFITKRLGSGGAKIAPDGHSEGGVTIKLPGLNRLLIPSTKDKMYDVIQTVVSDIVFTEDE